METSIVIPMRTETQLIGACSAKACGHFNLVSPSQLLQLDIFRILRRSSRAIFIDWLLYLPVL